MTSSESYLELLGIPVWRLRVEKPLACYRYEFYDDTGSQPVGLLFADASPGDAAEKQLVEAIVKATKKRAVGSVENEIKLGDITQARVIVLLGNEVAKKLQAGQCPLIQSYSPAELLANPSLKAAAWESLKKAMQMMG